MTRLISASSRLAGLWSDYRRRAGERAAIARLAGMSDKMLRDIGLERGNLREAVRNGRRHR